MHPSAALLAWLASVLAVQFLGYLGLSLLGVGALLSAPRAFFPWLNYIRRARWLLIVLWLVLAYNTPGEALFDWPWAPTYEGIALANLHALRLIVILACLAWLFERLGREGLVSALWGLLLPLQAFGLNCERLVVRLSLVLERLQSPPEKGAWKKMLHNEPDHRLGPDLMHLSQPVWKLSDTLLVLLVCLVFIGAFLL